MIRKWIFISLCLILILGSAHFSAAQSSTPAATESACTAATPAPVTDSSVRQQVILDKMRGQLMLVSRLWKQGNTADAAVHAKQPGDELLSLVAGDLKRACLYDSISKGLTDFATLTADPKTDQAAIDTALTGLSKLLDQAHAALIPADAVADLVFNFKVINGLLSASYTEYAEAVQDGKIVNAISLQESMAFTMIEAEEIYQEIQPALTLKYPDLDVELAQQWTVLNSTFPDGPTPRNPMLTPDEFKLTIDAMSQEMSKASGASLDVALTPLEYLNNAQQGLEDALTLYKDGKADDAYEAAASAYLDNFENVEAALSAKDRDLMESIETGMKAFRDAIKAGQSADEVQKILDDLLSKLGRAMALLG